MNDGKHLEDVLSKVPSYARASVRMLVHAKTRLEQQRSIQPDGAEVIETRDPVWPGENARQQTEASSPANQRR